MYALYDFINFHFIPGLVLGSIYALGAIGVTLTFGILRFANFAHGESMTLGAYFAWTIITLTGWHPMAALPIAMALTAAVSIGIDRGFYKPFRAAPTIMLVIASFGMMLMVRSGIQFSWGVQLKSLQSGIQQPMILFDAIRISPKHLIIFGAAVVLMVVIHLILSRTKMGKAMRAMSDSPELAKLTGIDTEQVIRNTWIIGGALAAAAGTLLAYDTHVETMMGFQVLLPTFAAAILGGIGKPYGAMIGGLIIGLAEELATYPWIGDVPLVSPGYKAGVAFVIMIGILLWRPSGIMRGRTF